MDILILSVGGRCFIRIVSFYAAVCLAGCTSFSPVKPEAFDAVRPGDVVKIKTVAGDVYKFKVTSVTTDRITGEAHSVAYEDIAKLSRKETDYGESAVFAVVIGIFLILLKHALDPIDALDSD